MKIQAIKESYLAIFEEEHHMRKKISPNDDPIRMNPLEAIGHVDDLENKLKKVAKMGHNQLREKSKLYFDDSNISEAFFYLWVAGKKQGISDKELRKEANELMHVTYTMPYEVHKLDWHPRGDPTVIFMDWDGTLDHGIELRKNTIEFLEGLKEENEKLGFKQYMPIITSASFGLLNKVRVKSEKILDLVDGIYSVPGVYKKENGKGDIVQGKLYTDICNRLHINYKSSIIITDTYVDRSVESTHPIVTLVTPRDFDANDWRHAVEFFESEGDGYVHDGASKIRLEPYDLIPKEKEDKPLRVYQTQNSVTLWRTDRLDHTFFLGHDLKNPPQTLPYWKDR